MTIFRRCRPVAKHVYWMIFITGAYILWNILVVHIDIPRIEIRISGNPSEARTHIRQDEIWQQEEINPSEARTQIRQDEIWQQKETNPSEARTQIRQDEIWQQKEINPSEARTQIRQGEIRQQEEINPSEAQTQIRQDEIWQEQIRQDEKWQRIPGQREVHVYSAYYDDRVTFPIVRVTSIVGRARNRKEDQMYCVFTFDKNSTTQIVPVISTIIGVGHRLHGVALKEYVLNCHLSGMEPPVNVSIVHQPDQAPSIQIPVQIPRRVDKRMNFMVCTCAAHGLTPPHKLIEWIEYLRMFGVDHVTIYNDSIAPESMKVFQYYAKLNIVDIRQSHNLMNDSDRWKLWIHNSPLLNDCFFRNMHKYHKIIVTDLDELIVPRTNDTYLEMLATIQHTVDTELTSGYVFQNTHFFLDHPGTDMNQSSHLATLRHRHRVQANRKGWFMKSIIEPRACFHMHNHLCLGVIPLYGNKPANYDVPAEIAMSHHYKFCDYDWKAHRENKNICKKDMENAIADDFMLKFKDKIIARVEPIIQDLHLEPL